MESSKSPPKIAVFPSGPYATNALVVSCPETKHAAIIDPAPGSAEQISAYIAQMGLTVEKVLLTHSHWDHIADVAPLKRQFQVPVYVHPEDAANLEQPGSDWVNPPFPIPIEGVKADHLLAEGDHIVVGNLDLEVWHTPGHCPGLVCFYLSAHDVIIVGDLFFRGSIGTVTSPTGEPERMWASLARVAELPPQTVVYPGHGEVTTVAREKWLPRAREIFES